MLFSLYGDNSFERYFHRVCVVVFNTTFVRRYNSKTMNSTIVSLIIGVREGFYKQVTTL